MWPVPDSSKLWVYQGRHRVYATEHGGCRKPSIQGIDGHKGQNYLFPPEEVKAGFLEEVTLELSLKGRVERSWLGSRGKRPVKQNGVDTTTQKHIPIHTQPSLHTPRGTFVNKSASG